MENAGGCGQPSYVAEIQGTMEYHGCVDNIQSYSKGSKSANLLHILPRILSGLILYSGPWRYTHEPLGFKELK